jgi:prolyl oligopeptidase
MKRRTLNRGGAPWLALLFVAASGWSQPLAAQTLAYPAAARDDVADDFHGTRVADPYRWLERDDDPRTAEWLRAEKRLSDGYLGALPRRTSIRRQLDALWSYARTGVPWREAGRLFYTANSGVQSQSAVYTQATERAPSRLVLDPNEISPDGSIAVGEYATSPDGRLLAYRTAPGGADLGEVRVRELATGRDRADVVRDTLTSVCWTHDARGFYYVHV